ncbi:bifunctional non-homologous end joining protein LigD [Actinacidiphila yanglinensis]|uniref:Bifunctional non-homologous end joining protein LigD n=1 Tax=Actinacidiphila yanglinensis TaxID=310779 RepID=A0A1H5YZM2_9ACTN|nr:bifunctional non-homologous end joining protein LigD [Actinacidiphila yanglinensis]
MAASDTSNGSGTPDPPEGADRGRPGRRAARGRDRRGRLAAYRGKRDFTRTAEPRGAGAGTDGGPVYVVQIHDASRTHFDFRLEVDGVLKSWAVPKGPSTDPQDKRLAVPTEDHPMEYRDFEGVIEAGEYGGGTVIVWDAGGYRNVSTDRSGREIPFGEALAHGHASFRLTGGKLRGRWSLTRFRKGEAGTEDDSGHARGEAWLLVRSAGDGARGGGRGAVRRDRARARTVGRAVQGTEERSSAAELPGDPDGSGGSGGARGSDSSGGSGSSAGSGSTHRSRGRENRGTPDPHLARSARTGRTLAQVAAAGGPTWHSNR